MAAPRPTSLPPLVKTVRVPISPPAAFALFTRGIADWWPLATHSVGEADAVACMMEEREGGRIVERDRDGSEHVWGSIRRWAPPHRLGFSWHPGRGSESAQAIEVRFAAAGDRDTDVTLEHGGWEALGERAAAMRANYDSGWNFVLGERYGAAARR
jgi:uncharacterized protein YndB with AHSA1/START domain